MCEGRPGRRTLQYDDYGPYTTLIYETEIIDRILWASSLIPHVVKYSDSNKVSDSSCPVTETRCRHVAPTAPLPVPDRLTVCSMLNAS